MRFLILALIVAVSGCANPLAVKKTVPPGTVGQAIQIGNITLTVVRAARSQTTAGSQTPAGLPNLTVQVNIKNDSDSTQTIEPSAFSVEDDQKKVHPPKEPFPQPAFAAKPIPKGESNAGLIAFEVPTSESLTLLFRPPQADYEPVRVNLTP